MSCDYSATKVCMRASNGPQLDFLARERRQRIAETRCEHMDKNEKDKAEETLLRLLANPPAVRHLSEDRCQRAAVRCRRRAEAAKDEIGKATWITFAKEWLKLADEAEQSTGGHGASRPGGWGHGMSAAGKS